VHEHVGEAGPAARVELEAAHVGAVPQADRAEQERQDRQLPLELLPRRRGGEGAGGGGGGGGGSG